MDSLVSQIKSNIPDLKDAEIEGVLYILLNSPGLSSADLVRMTGLPKETLRKFKSTLTSALEDTESDSINLKPEFSANLKALNPQPYSWSLLDASDVELAKRIGELRLKYLPDSKREYDQFFATPETTSAKVKVLLDKGQVKQKKIALLGDDDLVSFALGISSPGYSKIDVFEIDTDMVAQLKRASEDLSLKEINYIQYDARKAPLKQFEGRYDVVVTDPPYTASGVTLFLNRAVQFTGDKENAYIFLYFGNSYKSPEKFIKVQEIINKFGLVIEDKIDKFARYFGAESIGSASSLYILKTTKSTKSLDESILPRIIYTFENEKEEKFPYVDHVVAKVLDLPTAILKSKSKLESILGTLCNRHKLKVVDTKVSDFKGGGMTITYVLANSNLVVHTWPEYGAIHLDLITCAPIYRKDLLVNTLSELFKTSKIEFVEVQ